MACGLPVAAFPVMGPLDVVGGSGAGALDEDLRAAALAALEIPRGRARAHALTFTWENCARQFLENIAIARGVAPLATPRKALSLHDDALLSGTKHGCGRLTRSLDEPSSP
jgi:hypothetical protein